MENALDEGALVGKGPTSAAARGLQLLQVATRVQLERNMRVKADEKDFLEVLQHMRKTGIERPVPTKLMRRLRKVSDDDHESWDFAPVGVLSHIERDSINVAQVKRFAQRFGLPLVRWRKQMLDEIDREVDGVALRDDVYADEPDLWEYFVEGAPVTLEATIKSVRKLSNGSPGVLDSLSFEGGAIPPELERAYTLGGYQEVILDAPPKAVNIRVGGTTSPTGSEPGSAPGSVLWHGVELDDLSRLIESVTPDAQVVSLLISPNVEVAELHGLVAAQASLADTMRVKVFQYRLAFALTDFVSETGAERGIGNLVSASYYHPASVGLLSP